MSMTDLRRTGRDTWIPWAFVGFFLVVFAVNGAMMTIAFKTWTGLDTENAYQEGLAYNDRLAERRAQQALRWQAGFAFTASGPRQGEIALTLADADGNPLSRAAVTAALVRPTQAGHDITVTLDHQGDGRYAADVALPLAGQWDVRLLADHARGTYRLHERILVY
jgi:nitrogen fixation protein FixH